MKKLLLIFTLLLSCLTLTARAADGAAGAEALVQQQVDTVLGALNRDAARYQNDPAAFSQLISSEVLPYMDFDMMARIALGRYWKQITPAQQKSFTAAFRDFLVRFYSRNWTQYANAKVTILGNSGLDQYGRTNVRVEVKRPGKNADIIIFSLWQPKGQNAWKIYDVSFANVSIVLSYRSSFADDIEKMGIDSLIAKLRHMEK